MCTHTHTHTHTRTHAHTHAHTHTHARTHTHTVDTLLGTCPLHMPHILSKRLTSGRLQGRDRNVKKQVSCTRAKHSTAEGDKAVLAHPMTPPDLACHPIIPPDLACCKYRSMHGSNNDTSISNGFYSTQEHLFWCRLPSPTQALVSCVL